MADNVTLNAMTGGDVAAADDIGGVKHQRVKVEFGADGTATDVAPGSGLPTSNAYAELTGSASANSTDLIASTDVRAYRWLSVQLTGTFSATVRVQGSNDGTNWTDLILSQATGTTSPGLVNSMASAAVWAGAISTRYIRVRTTSYGSGTVTAVVELSTVPGVQQGVYVSGGGITINSTNQVTPLGDASTGQYIGGGGDRVFNGTSWDRLRSAVSAAGTTGTGLAGAGALGFDGTNFQRLKCDTNGNLLVHRTQAGGAALTSVTSSASTGTLLAANTARRGVIVVNESTATLYIAYAATASLTAYTVAVPPSYTWEMPDPVYTGLLSAIWSAANGAARVTELT